MNELLRLKRQDEFDSWIKEHRPGACRVGEFVNVDTKIMMQCECGEEWSIRPARFKRGDSCKKCGVKKLKKINTKTHEQFVTELTAINPDIAIIGTYTKGHDKILCQCKKCRSWWEPQADSLLQGKGCPICDIEKRAALRRSNNKEFDLWISINRPNAKRIGEYINDKTPISMQCECGRQWMCRPGSFKNYNHCKECGREANRMSKLKDEKEYIEQIAELGFLLCEPYINAKEKRKHKCMKCGTEFTTSPSNILRFATGCPICTKSKSRGEQFISAWLLDNDIKFTEQYFVSVNGHRHYFDFYLSELDTFVEYDGVQHYQAVDHFGGEERFQWQQERDAEKNQWCSENGYRLIRIKYDMKFGDVAELLGGVVQ